MKFTFVHHAEPDTVFARDAFNNSIGKTIRVNLPGRRDRDGTLVKAEVSYDGRSVQLTCEVDDSSEAAGLLNPAHHHDSFSVDFRPPAAIHFTAVEARPRKQPP